MQWMLAIWSLVLLPVLNAAWTSESSQFTYYWSLAWRIFFFFVGLENFEHYFTSMWDECHCEVVWAFFGIAFLWDWNENWPFPVLWSPLSFCWHIECSTFTALCFRIWNSPTGIPSPPLALFIVMLSNAHLSDTTKWLSLSITNGLSHETQLWHLSLSLRSCLP